MLDPETSPKWPNEHERAYFLSPLDNFQGYFLEIAAWIQTTFIFALRSTLVSPQHPAPNLTQTLVQQVSSLPELRDLCVSRVVQMWTSREGRKQWLNEPWISKNATAVPHFPKSGVHPSVTTSLSPSPSASSSL